MKNHNDTDQEHVCGPECMIIAATSLVILVKSTPNGTGIDVSHPLRIEMGVPGVDHEGRPSPPVVVQMAPADFAQQVGPVVDRIRASLS